MATPKKTSQQEKQPDALIIDKASFTAKLLDRIESGKELLNRSVTNLTELETNENDFYKWSDYNSEYLKQSFNNEQNEYKVRYDRVNDLMGFGGAYDSTPNAKLKRLKGYIGNKIEFLERLAEKVDILKSEVESPVAAKPAFPKSTTANNQIFIVHGHNTAIEQTVARTIEKLGLTPIILHEQANAGRTIIEKFEGNSDVGFAIILLTDDDEGKAKTEVDLRSRARQNVVLELGYFIGKLGRPRVLPLHSEGVEIPSDIHGLVYVPLDKAENWKFSIVKELREAGYTVDANKLL